MGGYQRRPTGKPRNRRRPPRRMAGCGHWYYSWAHRETCGRPECQPPPQDESLREFRQRLKDQGLLS